MTDEMSIAGTYPETVTVEWAGDVTPGRRQDVSWGMYSIGLLRMEYTVKAGDRITFYWSHPLHVNGPVAIRVNGGPLVLNDSEAQP